MMILLLNTKAQGCVYVRAERAFSAPCVDECVESADSAAQCVMSCVCPPQVISRDNDAFTFFSVFCFSLLQDSKMLNYAASYIFKV